MDSEQSKMEADMDKQNSLATAEGDANTMKSGYPISSGERFTLNLPNMARPPPPFPILPNITRPPPPYPLSLESSPNFMEFQSRPTYFQSPSSIAHGKPDPVVAPDSAGSSAPAVVKKKAIVLKGIDDLPGHKIVPNDIKNGARCTYCQVHRIKTPSGWRVKTNYKCETCDVALCASEVCERNCFHLHHIEMFGEQILGDKAQ